MRRLLVILSAVAALMLAAPPAGAIINGTPDTAHPEVGALLVNQGDGYSPLCSGSLLSVDPPVFLTAGHCVAYLQYVMPAGTPVAVSFDSDLNPGSDGLFHPANVIDVSGWAFMPSFFSHGSNHRDVGVLFISVAPTGLAAVTLPALGADEGLVGQQLTQVGYGMDSLDRSFSSPNANFTFPGQRLTGTEAVSTVTPSWVITHGDPNATCYGDSGGPLFLGDTVVSLTRSGDAACRSVGSEQRLDLPDVLTWLADQIS